jgi:branched-subunit amino acid ABC-type transport system permease component
MLHNLLIVSINGAFFGTIYGLFAVGLVVIYRGSRVINFANGEIGMIGAFLFVELWRTDHMVLLLAFVIGILASAAIGAGTHLVIIRPLEGKPRINAVVATLALDALLLFYAGRRWGLRPVYTVPVVRGAGFKLAGLHILPIQLLMLGASLAIIAILMAINRYSDLGLRLRATAVDPFMAGQLGVNVTQTSMLTWAMGGAIAALCAILLSSQVAFTVSYMTPILIRGLTAALLGGLTNPAGAFGFGLALGVLEGIIAYETSVPGVVEVVLAVFILVFLLARPKGLVGAEY